MTDTDTMPIGEHKGKTMEEVPDEYLFWFWGENKVNFFRGKLSKDASRVVAYIKDSFNESDLV